MFNPWLAAGRGGCPGYASDQMETWEIGIHGLEPGVMCAGRGEDDAAGYG